MHEIGPLFADFLIDFIIMILKYKHKLCYNVAYVGKVLVGNVSGAGDSLV